MKVVFFALAILTFEAALATSGSWKEESRAILDEYGYACKSTEIKIDSIVRNDHIKGHVKGLQQEALDKFKMVFYVKTNRWYIHPYGYYQGQEPGYSYSNLGADGSFQVKTVSRQIPAKELVAVLVPKPYKIVSQRWWLKPFLGLLGGILKYECNHTIVAGNGDF